MDTKEKEKKIRLRFYNIVIHPADKHVSVQKRIL